MMQNGAKMGPQIDPKIQKNRKKIDAKKGSKKRRLKFYPADHRRNARGCRGDYRGVKENKLKENKLKETE